MIRSKVSWLWKCRCLKGNWQINLAGICLRYRVSAVDLRRLNLFSGNNIQFKKTLRIPLSFDSVNEFKQIETNEVILQKFKNETNELNAEARAYLEDSNWNLESALASWRADSQWEATAPRSPLSVDSIEEEDGCGYVRPLAIEFAPSQLERKCTPASPPPPPHSATAMPAVVAPCAVWSPPPPLRNREVENGCDGDGSFSCTDPLLS